MSGGDDAARALESIRKLTPVSRETEARLETYIALLLRWTKAINLISKRSAETVWTRHILDSAQLIPHLPKPPKGRALRILDLGSGAGLPGLVLAILGAGELHLVEADQRKAAFLREAARVCALQSCLTVHAERIESLAENRRIPLPVDLVTARALASLDALLGHAEALSGAGTRCLFLKGRALDAELTLAEKAWKMRYRRFESCSDPDGVILDIEDFSRHDTRS